MRKTLLSALALAACCASLLALASSCTPKGTKSLVLYYSQSGTTQAVAQEIASQTGADIATIDLVEPYPSDYQATVQKSLSDRKEGILPQLKPLVVDLDKYDVIYLGYPIWFGTYAPPVEAFLKDNKLEGKTVVAFCSFGSGGLEKSMDDLRAALPAATIKCGYGVRAARKDAIGKEVTHFLRENGLTVGEYELYPEYGAAADVSEEEAGIFDAAVGTYPMIRASARKVAKRTTSAGRDYLFEAASLDPEGNENGTIKVFVTVPEGGQPEFTRVVR